MNILLLLIMLSFMLPSAFAQEIELEEVVVTATRVEEPIKETTGSVTVIDGEKIRKMNVEFVPDVLRKISDIHVVQNGGAGKVATIQLRGGNSSQTLVMIDGIRVNSTTTGSFDFSGITVDDIERIEIVKGPQSTSYGSDAMAGVINIITKKGEGTLKITGSLEAGSNSTFNPYAAADGTYKALDYRLTGTYFYTDGISAAKAGNERDGYKNAFLSGKLGFRPTEKFEVEFTGRYYYDKSDLDGFDFFAREAVDDRNFVQRGNHSLISGRVGIHLSDTWDQTITLSHVRDSLKFRDPDTAFNNAKIVSDIKTIDWQHDLHVSEEYLVTAGIEYMREKGENDVNFDQDLDNYALYLNNKLKCFEESLILNAGLRYDDRDISGSKTTYRVGAAYDIKSLALRIKASYGTGFRAPALNELFFPFYGNTNLKPEETKSWEIGLSKDFFRDRLLISVTYFDQEYENLITTNPLTFTAANISEAEVKGIEVTALIKMSEYMNVTAGYTYLDTEDRHTDKELPLRPQDKLNIAVDFSIKDLTVVADYIFIGKRFDPSVDRNLSSYSIVNLSGSYRAFKGLTVFARIDNLFDEDYEEIGSFGTPGLTLFGGLRVSI